MRNEFNLCYQAMIDEKGAKAISESNQERERGGYFAIIARLSCNFLLANRLSVERKEGDGLALLLQSEAQSTAMDVKGGK